LGGMAEVHQPNYEGYIFPENVSISAEVY